MTRKDTILIAVVINAGLLAILFMTAIIYDTDKRLDQTEFVIPLADVKIPQTEISPSLIASATTGDEVDNVLKYYTQPSSSSLVNHSSELYIAEPIVVTSNVEEDSIQEAPLEQQFIEVTIKKGDVLEKIARANETTVGAIKRINNLQNERLSIGQVLRIPGKKNSHSIAQKSVTQAKKQEPNKEVNSNDSVYYVIKTGDNPWKVAKQFNVKFEDILRLNHLNEEKARNLKVGDRIRVK